MICQTIAAYFEDDCADELTVDPIFTAILEKEALASQPTISRFFSRMDKTTPEQFDRIEQKMRDIVYAIKQPEHMVLILTQPCLILTANRKAKLSIAITRRTGIIRFCALTGSPVTFLRLSCGMEPIIAARMPTRS